jgi:hypothetical protein
MNLKLTVMKGWWPAFSLQGNIHHLKIRRLAAAVELAPNFDEGIMAVVLKNVSLS